MITVKDLRALLARLPDDAEVSAYEGVGIGLNVRHYSDDAPVQHTTFDGREVKYFHWWIEATDHRTPDDQGRNGLCP